MKQKEALAALLGHILGTQGDHYEKSILVKWMMTHQERSHTERFEHAAKQPLQQRSWWKQ